MSAAPRPTSTRLPELETEAGVCAIKVFAGSSTGTLMVEDDAHLERVMRSGRRRIAFHSEDEYRLQARKPLFHSGMPHRSHMEWRDEECAFLGTRRLMALARRTGRPAHILHVSTAEELEYLRDFRDVATVEVLVNHLTQVAPDCYDRLGGFGVMNPPIRGERHRAASWAAIADGTVDTIGSDHAPHSRAAKALPWPECPAGLTGVQTLVPIMLDHVSAGRLSLIASRRPHGGGAGARLRACRQGPARGGIRRRLHAGRHGAAADDRGQLDRVPLRLDALRRHQCPGVAGRPRSCAARRSCATTRCWVPPWAGSPGSADDRYQHDHGAPLAHPSRAELSSPPTAAIRPAVFNGYRFGPYHLPRRRLRAGRQRPDVVNLAWLRPLGGPGKPGTIPAASFAAKGGMKIAPCSEGGQCLGSTHDGDWVRYDRSDLRPDTRRIEFRVAVLGDGGRIEVHQATADGPLLGTCEVSETGGWQAWQSVTADVRPTGAGGAVCLVVRANGPTMPLWFGQVDEHRTTIWAQFKGVDPNAHRVEVNVRPTVFYPRTEG